MPTTLTCDVVVVGSGATGAVAAHRLSHAGLDVLVCEAGPTVDPVDRARLLGAHVAPPAPRTQPVQRRLPGFGRLTEPFFVDDALHPYESTGEQEFAWLRARHVGGRTMTWGGVTVRMSDLDFGAGSMDGASPDWPISYADLAPHYDAIEAHIGVQGALDQLAHVPDGTFLPPEQPTPAECAFASAVTERWPERRVVASRGIAGPAVRADATGERWPSGSTPVLYLDGLRRLPNARLRPDTIVASLLLHPHSGRVLGVRAIDRATHEPLEIRADVVVLCAGTIETTRILLNSRSADHPNGIGNSSGLLGRNLMDHPAITLLGTVPGFTTPSDDPGPGGPRGFSVPRFRNLPDAEPSAFVRGYQLWGYAQRGKTAADGSARFMFAACGEMLPNPENRVTLRRERTDHWGIPIPVIDFTYGSNERALMADARDQALAMCAAAGFRVASIDEHFTSIGTYIHEVGTARMGTDPATSVLDPWNRVWDAPNVLVTDGACWPTSANQNPTLTMMAITHRACTALADGTTRSGGTASPS